MFVFLLIGLVVLVAGAELLVRGATQVSAATGVSPLVTGLTIVAFGTSAPELAVSVHSALTGNPDLALGNVIGSNIFNVLFILGVSALITPLVVAQRLIRHDVPLMIGVSLLTYLLALDGQIGRREGMALFAGLVAYTTYAIFKGREEPTPVLAEYAGAFGQPARTDPGRSQVLARNVALIGAGLVMLVLGARWLIQGAIEMARFFAVSELVIGLTLVAAGTSLPEVATSIVAAVRGVRDIAVGNVVGSNLFNILGVLGLSALLAPTGIAVSSAALHFDLPVMMAVALVCLPIFFTDHRIDRWEGVVFLGYYLAYT
ncbi:MAG: calcium/sodium antiporter, partial [Gammaproteobacteria bacterium]